MATKRMLIDATHPEETRVVIVNGTRLEDFDVEVESRKQLKGNIYLAKVTRVEPSLQAAFVDYGGNRHGFLAFNEIHPDYYQIPVADRQALLADQEAQEAADDEAAHHAAAAAESAEPKAETGLEVVGGDEDIEVRRPLPPRRHYKIQEVIKRRQILLVQVVKEERGTKGAALTTYLSLAGRYCVLMPNTGRGGGISRKIAGGTDRKRLKEILGDLGIPEGMAVIVRTAGSDRSKAEIKRDYEYLMRVWSQVRELTLESIAPTLVHEEGNLIKRSIRDLYGNDIDEIVVDGDEGYRTAKEFMKLLIPSHAKRVQPYKDPTMPLLHRYQVEGQLDAIHSPQVQLKSGGYIVINPTEALVSIDVNSGRSTRERNIEETALRTNLEASDEIARQLRLRDLAGLIVIDFIDMEVNRNQTQVERRLKDAMRIDRARIQLGRISPFGLLELSRQRLRPSLIETSSVPCPHCGGTGIRRSTDSSALAVLRAIEEEGMHHRAEEIAVHVATPVALYILNQKRQALAEIEAKFQMKVFVVGDDTLIPPDHKIDRTKAKSQEAAAQAKAQAKVTVDAIAMEQDESPDEDVPPEEIEAARTEDGESEEGDQPKRRRRRRRRRRSGEDRDGRPERGPEPGHATADGQVPGEAEDVHVEDGHAADGDEDAGTGEPREGHPPGDGRDGEQKRGRRRRGRRGGRQRGRRREGETGQPTLDRPMPGMPDANVRLLGAPEIAGMLHAPDSAAGGVIEMPGDDRALEATAPEAIPEPNPVPVSDFAADPLPPAPEPVATSAPVEKRVEVAPEPPRLATAKTEVIDVDQAKKEAAGTKRGWWRRPAE